MLKDLVISDKECGRAITIRFSDGNPGLIEGLLARGDRRVGKVLEEVWRQGAKFDGWREHFDFDRWMQVSQQVLEEFGIDIAWYTTREREENEVLPWDHLDSGLDRGWLWDDYQESLGAQSLPDCRWADCNDCGVCPGLGVDLDFGETGKKLLPIVPAGCGQGKL